jgi:predicted nuclease of restriction endonuclease-like (RecB) superfamily
MSSDLTLYKNEFNEIIAIIEHSRLAVYRAVNTEIISMYFDIGAYISGKVENSGWGKSIVKQFSEFLMENYPDYKGFSPQNIWRMKQFFETYNGNKKLSPLVREISWSNNLLILSGAKTDEAREFYLRLCIKDNYSKRELERQIDSALYERTMISTEKHKELIAAKPSIVSLRDSYVLEFLDIPETHKEKDLRKSIIDNLKKFILEIGRDFSFIGEEFRIQVGNTDFYIDLLFYNRELSCLVAIDLKVGRFKPEHLGQLNFYLEALDRDVKKPHEQPSVGLILCASKDDDVVEYALSRNLSPALIAEYQTKLIDKRLLQVKLHELFESAESDDHGK